MGTGKICPVPKFIFLIGVNVKTTYVLEFKVLDTLKLTLLPQKTLVDYFFSRDKMVRWEVGTNKFLMIHGLIDIAFTREIILEPKEAKKEVNIKNVNYLVRRKLLGEYHFEEINKYGNAYHVTGEDVKNKNKLFSEYHLVFDEKIVEKTPPFGFKTVFYGNIYDYLEMKKSNYDGRDT